MCPFLPPSPKGKSVTRRDSSSSRGGEDNKAITQGKIFPTLRRLTVVWLSGEVQSVVSRALPVVPTNGCCPSTFFRFVLLSPLVNTHLTLILLEIYLRRCAHSVNPNSKHFIPMVFPIPSPKMIHSGIYHKTYAEF